MVQTVTKPGRPRAISERDRALRNIRFGWYRLHGATLEEIAREHKVDVSTVIRGLQDLKRYPKSPLRGEAGHGEPEGVID